MTEERQRESRVALAACASYDQATVDAAVGDILAPFGGMAGLVRPGQKVLLKVNLLMKRTPDRATTTHPAVVQALVRQVQAAGAVAIIADSPGGPFTAGMLRGIYEASGMEEVAKQTGAVLNQNFEVTCRQNLSGRLLKHLDLLAVLDEVDVVMSVGKLKTHGLTTMTGCVKNLFGVVPGTVKVEYHSRYNSKEDFCQALVDLCQAVAPGFCFIDAVDCMEGEGPSGGRPRHVGALIGGKNPHAVDAVGAQLIGLDDQKVPTLRLAGEQGLWEKLDIVGTPVEKLVVADFDIPMRKEGHRSRIQKLAVVAKIVQPKPVFTHRQCNSCGVCLRSCPVKAITLDNNQKPGVNLQKCIRCFCCQELCPKTDILVKRHPLMKLLR